MPPAEFKYDAAFSFLRDDETVALSLADLLADRFKCFVYSREQESLAGTDGELTFAHVFASEARTVVVLYRNGWGNTPWTRIEETAIRNRAYDQGYDFSLFIRLANDAVLPEWLPRTRLWFGLECWGLTGAASVIDERITSFGGVPSVESAAELARRLARTKERQEARSAFLGSSAGVSAAAAEFSAIAGEIRQLGAQLHADGSTSQFYFESHPRDFVAFVDGFSVKLHWQLQWGNSLDGSTLFVQLHRGIPGPAVYESSKVQRLRSWEFDFDRADEGLGWRQRGPKKRFLPSAQLADWAVSKLLKRIHNDDAV